MGIAALEDKVVQQAVELQCARVLGIDPGELVEVHLDTPKGLHYENVTVNACGLQAEFLEGLADKKTKSTILVRLRGVGAYIYKSDYPDLETGKMQHYRAEAPTCLTIRDIKQLPNPHQERPKA